MKRDMVGDVPGNVLGMLADLAHKLQHGSITAEELAIFLKGKKSFKQKPEPDIPALIIDWQNFYNDVFGIEADFSNLRIPKKQEGFDRLIILAKGMTPQKLYDKCKELFPTWEYTDTNLDEIVTSERTAKNNHYAIWIRNRVEADKELKNLSADNLKKKNILGITLEERLIYELKYFDETKSHLDIKNVTLCAGSCYSNGSVPFAHWCHDEFKVHWYYSGLRSGLLRARRVVS